MKTAPALDALLVIIAFALALALGSVAQLPLAGSWALAAGLAMAWWRLRRAGVRWSEVGLRRADPAWRVALAALGLVLIVTLGSALVVRPVGAALGWPAQDFSRFDGLRGNPGMLAAFLLLAWVSAACGEELLFRGVLMQRLRAAFGAGRGAALLALPLQAVVFAIGHAYLGLRGVATSLLVALVFGAAWLRNGRSLLPLVVAHGLIDTISLTALYAGAAG